MADKLQRSVSERDEDEEHALAVGKIEQYKILESLYRETCKENANLQEKLFELHKSREKDSLGVPSETESQVKGSVSKLSITQQILDAATTQQLEHPVEFYQHLEKQSRGTQLSNSRLVKTSIGLVKSVSDQDPKGSGGQVMEKEKNQEIEDLRRKSEDSQRSLKKFQHETDELRREIHQLVNTMTEKDGRMKELEERIQETLTEEERHSHLKKEQILREQVHKGSSWVFVDPLKANLSLEKTAFAKQDDETLSTAELRRKIDELQRRITELLNHNEKWNTLCKGLQEELDRVKGQLLQYQKDEGLAKDGLFEDLKLEMKRRRDAEEMSLKARKQVEELEAKVAYLEKQLEERERLERQMSMVAEELREKALIYEEQIRSYKEDFENEQRDHNMTRSQLDSLRNQWMTSYKSLQEKTQQLLAMSQQVEVLQNNNEELHRQLDQANRDAQLIRDHQKQQKEHTRTPPTEDLTSWECKRCTFHNEAVANVCLMCAASRHHHALLNEPSVSRGHASNTTVPMRGIFDTRFGAAPGFGELEEDGISCY